MFAQHARGLSALGQGAFEEAYQQLSAISPPGAFPAYTAYALKIPLDLVEAAVRTGRPDEAAAHLRAMRGAGLPSVSGHLALMTAAAAALCASDDDAAGLFEAALNVPGRIAGRSTGASAPGLRRTPTPAPRAGSSAAAPRRGTRRVPASRSLALGRQDSE